MKHAARALNLFFIPLCAWALREALLRLPDEDLCPVPWFFLRLYDFSSDFMA